MPGAGGGGREVGEVAHGPWRIGRRGPGRVGARRLGLAERRRPWRRSGASDGAAMEPASRRTRRRVRGHGRIAASRRCRRGAGRRGQRAASCRPAMTSRRTPAVAERAPRRRRSARRGGAPRAARQAHLRGRRRASPRRSRRRRPGPSPTARSPRRARPPRATQSSSPVGASTALDLGAVVAVTAARANSPAMPWPISAGVFGIARTTRSLPVARGDRVAADAGHHAELQRAADVRRAGRGGGREELRLDRPDDERRAVASEASAAASTRTPKLAAQALALRLARLDDDDRGGRAAAVDEAADDGAWPCCRRR